MYVEMGFSTKPISTCQHLSGWVVGWPSDDFNKVVHLSDYYCVFCCWHVEEYFSDSFICNSFFNHLPYSYLKYSFDASVPEDF